MAKNEQLRDVWRYLKAGPIPVSLSRTERRDLFSGMTTVLAAVVANPADQPNLFAALSRQFPDLTYYDADLQFSLRHVVIHGTFPLAKCKVTRDDADWIQSIDVLDSPWDPDLPLPPMKIITLEPDVDPSDAEPKRLLVQTPRGKYTIDLSISPRTILFDLQAPLSRHDPDLELVNYSKFVTKGQYLIVEDTFLNSHPVDWKHGPGAFEAVQWFMQKNKEFVVHDFDDHFLITMNPNGFLLRK